MSRVSDDGQRSEKAAQRRDPLAAEDAPAQRSPAARHEDELSPAKGLRDRARQNPNDRIGDGTPTGPITSPPAPDER